jgi:uncharacterized ubiquitin-like protein YukD
VRAVSFQLFEQLANVLDTIVRIVIDRLSLIVDDVELYLYQRNLKQGRLKVPQRKLADHQVSEGQLLKVVDLIEENV